MIDKRMMYAQGRRVGFEPGGMAGEHGMGAGVGADGTTGGSKDGGNTVDPGFQNALDKISTRQDTITNQNNTNYGQFFGSRVPTYSPMSFGNKVGNVVGGIGDYIKGGGLLGMGIRGLTGLLGGPTASTGNVGPAGINTDGTYGTVGDAIDAGRRNEPPGEEGQGIMAAYTPNMLNVSGEVVDQVPVSQEEEDFYQRFRGFNRTRQDKEGQLDAAILDMLSKLYT